MNASQAKEALKLFRPGSIDRRDSEVGIALEMAKEDTELRSFLEWQNEFHVKIRQSLRQIQPPVGLKTRILARRTPAVKIIWWKRPELMALAAAVAILIGSLAFWLPSPGSNSFADYHARMAKTALREYRMNMVSSDPSQIRSFLAGHGHPADYEIPEKISKLSGAGCALLRWNDHPVSLVCLRQPNQDLLWLFVAKADVFKKQATVSKPEFRQTGKLASVTWTARGLTYILAGFGDKNLVKSYL